MVQPTSPEMGFPQTTPPDPEEDPLHRRMVLVGKTGAGKSATGNTILGEERFRSELSSSSITSECELHQEVVSGRNISVIDTSGLFDTKISKEKLSLEIGRSIYLSSPGPHAYLYVQPVNLRFTEQEENVLQKLELIFGREMKKYTIILFTYGDLLKKKSVEEMIQENGSLSKLVSECGGRYHIFNNEQPRNREQVNELLEKIDRMVEENGGTYYSNQMYEQAMRFRKEEERMREEQERLRSELEETRRREEQERHRRELEESRMREEQERLKRELEETRRREEQERHRREMEETRMREEQERLRRELEETRRREEQERLRREMEETRRREELERLRRELEETRIREKQERLGRELEETRRKEEQERHRRELEETMIRERSVCHIL